MLLDLSSDQTFIDCDQRKEVLWELLASTEEPVQTVMLWGPTGKRKKKTGRESVVEMRVQKGFFNENGSV